MMISQIDTALKVVNTAAAATDRWLFLAAIGVIMVGGVFVIRFLVRSIETKDAGHAAERLALASEVKSERETAKADNRADRAAAQAERKADQVEYLRLLDALKAEIKVLAESVAKNTETLQKHDTDMRIAHSLEIGVIVKGELEENGYLRCRPSAEGEELICTAMNTIAYLIFHAGSIGAAGAVAILINLLIFALIVLVIFWVLGLLGVPSQIQRVIAASLSSRSSPAARPAAFSSPARNLPRTFASLSTPTTCNATMTSGRCEIDITGLRSSPSILAQGKAAHEAMNGVQGIIGTTGAAIATSGLAKMAR